MDGLQYEFQIFALGTKMDVYYLFQDEEYQKKGIQGMGEVEGKRMNLIYNEFALCVVNPL